ncbi:hypothetical protein GCM10009422_28020 [Brevundimonas kwangchunensis]|uniref:CdiI immunity protein domain-containing protein n=1 Tax=Brevundimonas kwangchunensis TaxID=322163 RepID=A0ABP3SBM0_9CAUL
MSLEYLNVSGALDSWRRFHSDPEADWDAFEAIEAYILKRVPRDRDEAVAILEVLITQAGDPRSDGLDQLALTRVRDFVRNLDQDIASRRKA